MNDQMNSLMSQVFFGNSVEQWAWFFTILLAGFIFKKFFSKAFSSLLFRILKKFSGNTSARELNDLLKKPLGFLLLLIFGYIAASQLDFPDSWETQKDETLSVEIVVHMIYKILIIFSLTWILVRLVDFLGLILKSRAEKTDSKLDDQLVPFFRDTLKILVVLFSLFFILAAVFEVNVVTLIGGLGIGGLAVALAAKETLENLLGSFTIFLDKPFIVGDQVIVDKVNGHVESIGLRSTRIRTLEKTLVTVPNKKMVDAELENITERTLWRVRFSIGVLYTTSKDDLENINKQIRKALDDHMLISTDPVVRFENYGESSLNILISYLVTTNEFGVMAEVREEINFRIMEIVRANNTDFAFPSTSLYVEKIPTK
jgi:MscS family membrane protein